MSEEKSKWRYVGKETAAAHELYGVGGWLLFFAVGCFLGLLADLGRVNTDARSMGLSVGGYLSIPHPSIGLTKATLLYEVIAVACIYWMMFSKSVNFRKYTSVLLLSMFPVVCLVAFVNSYEGVGAALASGFIRWAVSCGVWVSYLQLSTRVRVTFEHCIPEESQKIQNHNQSLISPGSEHVSTIAPAVAGEEARVTIPASDEPEEQFWAIALSECDEQKMRPGLWAKAFADAQGQEAVAKAQYMRLRAAQLQTEHMLLKEQEFAEKQRAHQAEMFQQQELEAEQAIALAKMSEDERIEALKPKGRCPNCSAVINLESKSCSHCNAIFGNDSAWQIQTLSSAEQAALRVASKAMHYESQTETSGDSVLPGVLIAVVPFLLFFIFIAFK
jgi:Protein of unknown function (DUF2569)